MYIAVTPKGRKLLRIMGVEPSPLPAMAEVLSESERFVLVQCFTSPDRTVTDFILQLVFGFQVALEEDYSTREIRKTVLLALGSLSHRGLISILPSADNEISVQLKPEGEELAKALYLRMV